LAVTEEEAFKIAFDFKFNTATETRTLMFHT